MIYFQQLYASVLLKDPVTSGKGKVFLERALNIGNRYHIVLVIETKRRLRLFFLLDPRYSPALYLLIDAYEQVKILQLLTFHDVFLY